MTVTEVISQEVGLPASHRIVKNMRDMFFRDFRIPLDEGTEELNDERKDMLMKWLDMFV